MKLEKAIEIGTMFDENRWPGPAKDFNNALKLLIEASNRFLKLRRRKYVMNFTLLPGETKEGYDAQSLEG